jgi:hypothetical protein
VPSSNALSLTAYVKAWLADAHDPRILHIFDRACNLINERGEAGILWHEFFAALASNDFYRTQDTMKSILAVGEISGANALAGFTDVFISLTKGPSHD